MLCSCKRDQAWASGSFADSFRNVSRLMMDTSVTQKGLAYVIFPSLQLISEYTVSLKVHFGIQSSSYGVPFWLMSVYVLVYTH